MCSQFDASCAILDFCVDVFVFGAGMRDYLTQKNVAVLALLQKKLQFFRDKVMIDAGDLDRSSVGDVRPVANWINRFKFALSDGGRELE